MTTRFVMLAGLYLGLHFTQGFATPPINDDFANRIDLGSSLPVQTVGSNIDATLEPGEIDDGGYRNSSVWWSWSAPTDGGVVLSAMGSSIETFISVGVLNTEGGYEERNYTYGFPVQLDATGGETYVICVGGVNGEEGAVALEITPDDPTIVQSLTLNRYTLTPAERTLTATINLQDDDEIVDIYGEFASSAGGFVSIADHGYPFVPLSGTAADGTWDLVFEFPEDAAEGIWTLSWIGVVDQNGSFSSFYEDDLRAEGFSVDVVFDDPSNGPLLFPITGEARAAAGGTVSGGGSFAFRSSVDLVATAAPGFDFVQWVKVTEYEDIAAGSTPSITVLVTGPATYAAQFRPANDNFANATNLGNPPSITNTSGFTSGGSAEVDEPGGLFEDDASSWWAWTSPVSGLVDVTTAGSNFDTVLTIFTGQQLTSLQLIGQSHDFAPDGTSRVAFIATQGTQYFFRVHGEGAVYEGQVSLSLATQSAAATADDHVAWGKAVLRFPGRYTADEAALDGALVHFDQAIALSSTHGEALFYKALVRLALLQKDAAFEQLLVDLGVEDLNSNPATPEYSLPSNPSSGIDFADGANTNQVKSYLQESFRIRLEEVLALLARIRSTTFAGVVPDWLEIHNGKDTRLLDQGDVTLLRASCAFLLGSIELIRTAELGASLETLATMDHEDRLDAQSVLAEFDNLLKFASSDRRRAALTQFRSSLDLYSEGSAFIRTKRPPAEDNRHLFSLQEAGTEDEREVRELLQKANLSLKGSVQTVDGWQINLSRLFVTTRSLRSLTPNFKGNEVVTGSVPNLTLDGTLPKATRATVEAKLKDNNMLYEGEVSLAVTIAAGEEARGAVTGDVTVLAGTEVTATATPNPGYVFGAWTANNGVTSLANPYVFPLVGDIQLVASFYQDSRDLDNDGLDVFSELQAGTDPANPDSDGDGWPDGLDADPMQANPIRFSISETVDLSAALQAGTIISISGLPRGLTFNRVTGKISGKAISVKATSQIFTPVAVVRSLGGKVFRLPLRMTIDALPAGFIGSFFGLVAEDADPDLGDGLGGQVDLLVAPSGICSGKILLAGRTIGFRDALDFLPGAPPELHVLVSLRNGKSLSLDLVLDPADRFTGSLTDESSESTSVAGWRNVWGATPLAGVSLGYFTTQLIPDAVLGGIGDPSVPQGTGYLSVTTTKTGVSTWKGRGADGVTVITRKFLLGPDGNLGFWAPLYRNRGSILGEGVINDADGVITASVKWTKKADLSPGRSYPDGFAAVLNPTGGAYSPTILSAFVNSDFAASTPNATLSFTGADVESSATDPDVAPTFSVGTRGVVFAVPRATRIPATNPNPGSVICKLDTKTGVFSGSFKLSDPNPAGGSKPLLRTAPFFGIVTPGGGAFGAGAFLLPELSTTPKTAPILSGQVALEPNP